LSLAELKTMPSNEPLPIHAIPSVRAARLRGRPPKVRLQPAADERAYHEQLAERRADALDHDPLVRAADEHGYGDVIGQVIVEIAAEAAGLRFDRERAQDRGLEHTPQLCSRVLDAYSKLSTLVLVRHELQRGNPTDAQIERVKALFLGDIEEIVTDVLGVEVAGPFIERLRTAIGSRDETAR
jgi:hypothetical protein